MKKILLWMSVLFFAAFIAVVGISYYILTKFSQRPYISEQLQKKIDQRQLILIQEKKGQPVTLLTADGIKISALYFDRPHAQRSLIVGHGWWMNKESMRAIIDYFPDTVILLFDFRAHGKSEGGFTSIGHYEQHEIEAAFNFVHDRHPDLPIYGMGVSMGVSALLAAASKLSFAGLILESSFRRLDQAIEERFAHYTGLPTFPFMTICKLLYHWCYGISMASINNLHAIKKLCLPIFIIHSKGDTLAPHHIADELYESIGHEEKDLWKVDQAPHATIYKKYGDLFKEKVSQFFSKVETSKKQ